MPSTEAKLIAGAQGGSQEAFEALFLTHIPMLFAYSRAICGDFHAAEDVVQETALVAYQNLSHFFPGVDFDVWLRAIARRRALESRRKLARVRLGDDELIERVYAEEASDPRRDALARCLHALAGRMGSLVHGFYLSGTPLAKLAQELSMTPNAAKQLLYRARLQLRQCVHRRMREGETP
jgi:RNA polymerase sigma-70 factor (ECF subfamily)